MRSSCDAPFTIGKQYLVFASRGTGVRPYPPDLSTSWCAGTTPVADAANYLAALGPGRPLAVTAHPLAAGVMVGVLDLADSAVVASTDSDRAAPPERPPAVFAASGIQPGAIATDPQGNVYIVDARYYFPHVLKYSSAGALLFGWRNFPGSTAEPFLQPFAVADVGVADVQRHYQSRQHSFRARSLSMGRGISTCSETGRRAFRSRIAHPSPSRPAPSRRPPSGRHYSTWPGGLRVAGLSFLVSRRRARYCAAVAQKRSPLVKRRGRV